jgi:formylglycine-generating enzyme required for sulfatase activity
MYVDKPMAFMSYTRFDDERDNFYLTDLRKRLGGAVHARTGGKFVIFQDTEHIEWGQKFQERIAETLKDVIFLIPIITASFFESKYCREELRQFLKREDELGQHDLILSIYYTTCDVMDDEDERADDDLAQVIASRQFIDWRDLRYKPLDDSDVRRRLDDMAEHINKAMKSVKTRVSSQPQDFETLIVEQREMSVLLNEQHQMVEHILQLMQDLRKSTHQPASINPTLLQQKVVDLHKHFAQLQAERDEADTHFWRLANIRDKIMQQLRLSAAMIEPTHPQPPTKDGAELSFVPAALFTPGPPRRTAAEHRLAERFVRAFYIDTYPVTNDQFKRFVEATGYETVAEQRNRTEGRNDPTWKTIEGPGSSINGLESYPVIWVCLRDARAYADWAGRRLPNSLEWERAARGVSGQIWPWGEEWQPDACNIGSGGVRPVTSHPKGVSPVGCWNMVGNVWEWVDNTRPAEKEDGDEAAPNDEFLLMGGSWKDTWPEPGKLPFSYQAVRIERDIASPMIGFRCAMDVPTESKE